MYKKMKLGSCGCVFGMLAFAAFGGADQRQVFVATRPKSSAEEGARYQVVVVNRVPVLERNGQPIRGRMLLAARGDWRSYRVGPVGAGEGLVDFTFRAAGTAASDGFIKLAFDRLPGTFFVDDICLTEADGEKPVFGPYTFENGMDAFMREWEVLGTNKTGAACAVSIVPGEWKSKALKVVIAPETGKSSSPFVLQSRTRLTLRQGVFYRVFLRARSDPARQVNIDVGSDRGPLPSLLESEPPFAAEVKLAAQAGVNWVTTYARSPWQKLKEGDAWSETATQRVLDANPQAVVFPRINLEPGYWWREQNPDDVMVWENGFISPDGLTYIYGGKGTSMPDVASKKYWKESGERLVAYLRAMERKYGDSIGGYHLGGGSSSEWMYHHLHKYHGYSVVSKMAWRNWLKETYGTDGALAEIWNRPGAWIDHAEPPTPEARYRPQYGGFYNPETQRDIIDFNQFQQDMMADAILHFAKLARAETQGRKLIVFFYGYGYEWSFLDVGPASTGHYALRKILQSPDIDAISSPIAYFDRQRGGSGPMMTQLESVNLAGKIWFSEDDTSTHLSTGKPPGSNVRSKNMEESVNLLRRNTVQAALRNYAAWWMDLRSRGWFADPGLWDEMRRLEKVDRPMLENPVPFEPGIAVLFDEYSMLAVGFKGSRVTRPLIYEGRAELGRVGAPYGQYLLDDFISGKVGKAKLLVFLNAWNLDAAQRAGILRQGAGKVRFWCHAAGLMDGRRASVENMTALTGFAYRRLPSLTEKEKARVKATPAGLALGLAGEWDSLPADPLFAVTDAKPEETLATWPDGSAAVALRRGADGADLFCGIPKIPAALYRAAARIAEVHLYTADEECNVYANGPFVALHASQDGNIRVQLPCESKIFDALSDEKLGDGRQLTLPMKKGETRVLRYSNKK